MNHPQEKVNKIEIHKGNLRCRYALRFGDNKSDNENKGNRNADVRIAFNSPFPPFVLATTSVGQEGLDFHQYCHRVVHWNLPSNPVDLEQREGRVHRYKGHVVRRNLADFYKLRTLNTKAKLTADPWKQLFDKAKHERSAKTNDLVPFWIFDQGEHKIERLIPILPLSSEIVKLRYLKNALVMYRAVIGQPRQEEMLQFLDSYYPEKIRNEIIANALIDLSPQVICD